jgi:hypothetical protein
MTKKEQPIQIKINWFALAMAVIGFAIATWLTISWIIRTRV